MMIKQFSLLIVLTTLPFTEVASTEIIVNNNNQYSHISRKELLAIYTMRQRYWPDGTPITAFILPDSRTHNQFCKQQLKIFPHQLRSRWDRLVYSGTGVAPIMVQTGNEMISKIAQTYGAIGYINKVDHDDDIKKIILR